MKRRDFIKAAGPLAATPFLISGLPIKSYAGSALLNYINKTSGAQNGKVFVFIQLNGGNDGLNTVIPLDQYNNLSIARPNLLIPANNVLPLTGVTGTGLHPSMTGLQDMYNNGLVSITQGVSYPNPDFSHFRAMDIWMTASDSNQYLDTGWLARYLEQEFPGYPTGYPTTAMPDPLAIQIGSVVSLLLTGSAPVGISIEDPTQVYQFQNGIVDPAPNSYYGHELTFVRQLEQQSQQYYTSIVNAANHVTNLSTKYPTTGTNSLADQLKIVAQLIAGGLKTPIYVCNLDGFDTHALQTPITGSTSTGVHADLLSQLSVAISAFQDDLKLLQIDNRVAGMTFSEFGRRIESNASHGTDHGTAAPVIVFGTGVIPGIIGTNPVIPSTITVSDNLAMQNDFRSIYTSILQDWFGAPTAEINTVLSSTYNTLPIFKKGANAINEIKQLGQSITIAPNPVTSMAQVSYELATGGFVNVMLFDISGKMISTLFNGQQLEGLQQFVFERKSLPSGIYVLKITKDSNEIATKRINLL